MGKYIKLFRTTAQYEAYTADTGNFVKPNVSVTLDDKHVHYNKYDYYDKYLTFKAREQGTFTLTIGSAVSTSILSSISYSTDSGETWTTTNNVNSQTVTITTPTVNQGDKVMWKGIGVGVSTTINNSNRPSTSSIFSSTGTFDVEGNIMSLIYGDEFIDKDYVAEGSSYNFALLFYANTGHVGTNYAKVVSAKKMCMPIKSVPTCCYMRMFQETNGKIANSTLTEAPDLPATTLAASAYTSMFLSCYSLTTIPSILPATTLANRCYESMFGDCTSLTTTPELPATTLAEKCYGTMFANCTSLTTAPELPATTLASNCYNNMFTGCTSLTSAHELPATTLESQCYQAMFYNCTSLATAPELPATTLATKCYESMFQNCTSLTTAPVLSATTLAERCYYDMFNGCTSLMAAPELPATTLVSSCYLRMFSGCTSLSSIKCLATDISATNCTSNWVNGVASYGTFAKAASMDSWTEGDNGIPSDWSVVTAT